MDVQTKGFCDPRFEKVSNVFNDLLASGADLGASFCATWKGEVIVDIWGGHLDETRQLEWQQDTLVNVYSTTKTMSFLCALLLADRGELDFNLPVSHYWPEFSANGKSGVLVWHLMNHAAGLSGMDEVMTTEDLYDWDKVTQALARQTPWLSRNNSGLSHRRAGQENYRLVAGPLFYRAHRQAAGRRFLYRCSRCRILTYWGPAAPSQLKRYRRPRYSGLNCSTNIQEPARLST